MISSALIKDRTGRQTTGDVKIEVATRAPRSFAFGPFVLVPENEIRAAMALMIETTRNLVEAAGASPLVAALRLRDRLAGKRIALVLSGGNASRDQLLAALE